MAGLVLARFDVLTADARASDGPQSLLTVARRRWRALAYVALLSAFLAATFSPRYRGRRDVAAFGVRAAIAVTLQASFSFSQLRLADLPPPPSRAGWLLFARSRLVMPALIAVLNTSARLPAAPFRALTALQAASFAVWQPYVCESMTSRVFRGSTPYFESTATKSADWMPTCSLALHLWAPLQSCLSLQCIIANLQEDVVTFNCMSLPGVAR